MARAPSAAVMVAAQSVKVTPSADKLTKMRELLAEAREIEMDLAELAERAREKQSRLTVIKTEELTTLFEQTGIDSLGLDAVGNLPAYDAELKEYYHASIPHEQQDAAFRLLHDKDWGDVVKHTVTVTFGLREARAAAKFKVALRKMGVEYDDKQTVPWNTLTALIKAEFKAGRPLKSDEMTTLGATTGTVVNIKKRKVD